MELLIYVLGVIFVFGLSLFIKYKLDNNTLYDMTYGDLGMIIILSFLHIIGLIVMIAFAFSIIEDKKVFRKKSNKLNKK